MKNYIEENSYLQFIDLVLDVYAVRNNIDK